MSETVTGHCGKSLCPRPILPTNEKTFVSRSFLSLHFHRVDLVSSTTDSFLFFKPAAARKPGAEREVRQQQLCTAFEDGFWLHALLQACHFKNLLSLFRDVIMYYYSTDLNLSEIKQNEMKMRLLLSKCADLMWVFTTSGQVRFM